MRQGVLPRGDHPMRQHAPIPTHLIAEPVDAREPRAPGLLPAVSAWLPKDSRASRCPALRGALQFPPARRPSSDAGRRSAVRRARAARRALALSLFGYGNFLGSSIEPRWIQRQPAFLTFDLAQPRGERPARWPATALFRTGRPKGQAAPIAQNAPRKRTCALWEGWSRH